MKIKQITNTNFGKISVTKKAQHVLSERLNPAETHYFNTLVKDQATNKTNIYLDTFEHKSGKFSSVATNKLMATVGSDPNIYCEDFVSQNTSPIAFIDRLCKYANETKFFTVDSILKKF